jgi:hypothetical protein
MKKLLALILAAICCLGMFACGGEDHSKTLDDAISLLNSLYKDTTRTPSDIEVVGSVKVGDKTVNVTWTVDNDAIKVVKNGKMYTIDVPSANETETTYVLKATAKIGGQSKSKEFTITLPVIDPTAAIGNPEDGKAYKLYMNQVNLGLGALNIYPTLLMQRGVNLYDDELSSVNMTSEEAVNTFTMWTDFYNKYSFDKTYDFYNRFRTGTMPLAIQPGTPTSSFP